MTEVSICNTALSRVGVSRQLSGDVDGTLANCTDTSVEKRLCDLHYPQVRNRFLRSFPWPFARKYATLVLADDGTGEVWEEEWDFAYTYPADCLRAWRFVTDVGTAGGNWSTYLSFFGPNAQWIYGQQWRFIIRSHAGATVILTNVVEADADLEYVHAVTDTADFPVDFEDALTWWLAYELAYPLTEDRRHAEAIFPDYVRARRLAQATGLNEEHGWPEPDGDFVAARGDD